MCINCDCCECDCPECDDRTDEQIAIDEDSSLSPREKFVKYLTTLDWPQATKDAMLVAYDNSFDEGMNPKNESAQQ